MNHRQQILSLFMMPMSLFITHGFWLANHATEDSARNIVDEKAIVPEKTKEEAHQESTAVSAVNNE